MWLAVMHTQCSITTDFHLVIDTAKKYLSPLLLMYLIPSFVAFLMGLPHVHGTSTASVASAGFASASEGSTAGTLEASWRVRTGCSVGDPKNFNPKMV